MDTMSRTKTHHLNQPMFGLFTPKSAADSSAIRGHFVAAAGEFVGTFFFLFTAYLGHAMSVFGLLVAAWILYRVSGGLFNPAVTLGMIITGTLPTIRGLVLFPTQIIGGICAAAVVSCIIPVDIATVQTTLAPNMSVAQGLFLEMVCNHFQPILRPISTTS
jgi:aquaporin related protein